jgi:tetratricopeptide (TPR) repeat protein
MVVIGSLIAVTLAGCWQLTPATMSPCEREVRYGDRRRGAALCLESYAQTGNESDLAWAAKAYMFLGDLDEAAARARRLLELHGARVGDAHAILGYVALRSKQSENSRMHVAIALAAHRFIGDERAVTSDYVLLSQIAWQVGDYTAALDAADEALKLARRLNDPRSEVAAYMAHADALRRMGDSGAAAAELETALEHATDPCDNAWAHVKNGMCQMEIGQDSVAGSEFAMAEQANRSCGSQDVAKAVAINLAWLRRRKDPPGALARLDEIAKSEADDVETLVLRAYLAADRDALDEADGYLVRAASLEPPHADWSWTIMCGRAELSEQRGGLSGNALAEDYYRRSAAMVASLRTAARTRSAFLVSSHREPYDGLIALLARQGRWRDVLEVVLDLDASDMLRATADREIPARGLMGVDAPIPGAVTTLPSGVDAVLSAWRSRDLVIVIAPSQREIGPGDEHVYRVHITDGQITGEVVGEASVARKSAHNLFADPGDKSAARALGQMLVPPGSSGSTLHVLAIGPLGRVPLGALRDARGSLISRRRPLVRVLGLRMAGPEASGGGPPVIIADPQGDLPLAVVEGIAVAGILGAGTQRSGYAAASPATKDRLWAARDAELLHVAAHVGGTGRWRPLHLANGEVNPAEMVQHRLAPRIAVLASCGSAAATDEEGWGSIAAALLESGTATVIATDRSIADAASLSFMLRFYAQSDWQTDPARALARVQQALDAQTATSNEEATNPRSWAAFSVLVRPPFVPERSSAVRPR